MTLIGRQLLDAYVKKHAACLNPLQAWVRIAEDAQWRTSQDIKNGFRSADFLSGNRVIFNIKGNDHRLVVAVAYQQGIVQIQWIGTHAEYNKKTLD